MDDGAIFRAIYGPLRRFAAVVGPPHVEPDDLVQAALERVLRRRELVELDDPAAYLRRVIVRLASNERRGFARRLGAFERLTAVPESFVAPPEVGGLDELWSLTSEQRAVVYLKVIDGEPHDRIAELLGITAETSRRRLSRALAHLRSGATDNEMELS